MGMRDMKPAWRSAELPAIKSVWDDDHIRTSVRVMAVAEGYVMCRRKGAAPFIVHMSDWYRRFRLKHDPSASQ
jgi:hypothetical protein